MADKPSWLRGTLGRVWDAATPGVRNYDRQTGQFSHTGNGIAQVGLRALGLITGNPLIGTVGPRVVAGIANRADAAPQAIQREGVPIYGAPTSAQNAFVAPTIANLGLGAQTPGNSWQGYMQGQGSANNFGNTQFGNGMASVPSSWAPQSTWGQSVAEGQGSNINFGNNSPGAVATGAVRGGSTGASGVNSGARGVGGNSVGDAGGARSAFWRKTHSIN